MAYTTHWQADNKAAEKNSLKGGSILCSQQVILSKLRTHLLSVHRKPGAQSPLITFTYISLSGVWVPASTPFFSLPSKVLQALPQPRRVELRSMYSRANRPGLRFLTHFALVRGFLEGSKRCLFFQLVPLLFYLNPSATRRLSVG